MEASQVDGYLYFLLPHEVFYSLITPDNLSEFTSIGEEKPELAARRDAWCHSMGIKDLANIVMCGLWGDSAPYSTRDSLYVLLYNCLSGRHRTRFWLTAFPKKVTCRCGCQGKCTFQVAFDVLNWSFECLLTGRLPMKRHDLKDFEPSQDSWREKVKGLYLPCKAGVFEKRGDWAWLKQALSLQGWKDGNRVCFRCPCTKASMREFGLSASWRHTIFSHRSFVADLVRANKMMPLLGLPGFQCTWIVSDMMHTGCLGVVPLAIGNFLFEIFVDMGGMVSKPEHGMGLLVSLVHQACKALGIQPPVNTLTFPMLRQDGKHIVAKFKAAESRHMLPVVRFMMCHFFKAANDRDSLKFNCLDQLCKVYETMEPAAWDPATSQPKLADAGRRFCILYGELSRHAIDGGDIHGIHFRITPKFHMFLHCCEESTDNPRNSWAYSDESEIGLATTLAESLHPATMPRVIMERYRL